MLLFKCTDGYTLVYGHMLFIPLTSVCFGVTLNKSDKLSKKVQNTLM